MKTFSLWSAALVVGVGLAASATQASTAHDGATRAVPITAVSVDGAVNVLQSTASKKTRGEQVAWCFRRWNGTWGCI